MYHGYQITKGLSSRQEIPGVGIHLESAGRRFGIRATRFGRRRPTRRSAGSNLGHWWLWRCRWWHRWEQLQFLWKFSDAANFSCTPATSNSTASIAAFSRIRANLQNRPWMLAAVCLLDTVG